jgi:hypothetical protein
MAALLRPLALIVLVCFPLTASANHWRRAPVTAAYYYYPWAPAVALPIAAPIAFPIPAAPPIAPSCPAQPPLYAEPAPAPAAPPMPPARVTESRYGPETTTSYYRSPAGQVTVSFYNQTGRALTLRIGGQTYDVMPRRGLTLDVPRQFQWQRDDRPAEEESVPLSREGMSITFRR